jgi:hypothetical protein
VLNDSLAGMIADGGAIDITGAMTNLGTMTAYGSGSIAVHGVLKNSGQLIADGGTILVDTLRGSGSASIVDTGTIDLTGASNAHIDFSGGDGGNLILEDVGHFRGDISGFDDSDMITLKSLLIGPDTRLAYNHDTGLLRVVDHGGVEAKLTFDGDYALSDFKLTDDGAGHVAIQHFQPAGG